MGLRFFRSLLAQNLAPAVTYYVRGTSTNVGGTETFTIQYIADGASTPDTATTETVNVAADGSWEFSYSGKMIYSLHNFAQNNTRLTALDLSAADDLTELASASDAFVGCTHLAAINIGSYTWSVDVVLSACPITSASMLAFLGNFADYSQGAQHLVRISPYTAIDMGSAADTQKTSLAAKNWKLPLSMLGIYSRAQLKTMIDGGYIPISSADDWGKINAGATSAMGSESEFFGDYYCTSASNYVLVNEVVLTSRVQRLVNGILDGNNLSFIAHVDNLIGATISTVGSNGEVKNMHYYGDVHGHNGCGSFVDENNGQINKCCVEIFASGSVSQEYGFCRLNNGVVSEVIIRLIESNSFDTTAYYMTRLLGNNTGSMSDIFVFGTYFGASLTNRGNSAFARQNNSDCTRFVNNIIPNVTSAGFAYDNTGTLVDVYKNTTRGLGQRYGEAKTDAELKADAIGVGMYANFSTAVWTKDNDGYPTLIIGRSFKWSNNVTRIASYRPLEMLCNSLETQLTAQTLVISATLWGNLTSAEQTTIDSILTAKNWSRALA